MPVITITATQILATTEKRVATAERNLVPSSPLLSPIETVAHKETSPPIQIVVAAK
jgi:hypothetical protein